MRFMIAGFNNTKRVTANWAEVLAYRGREGAAQEPGGRSGKDAGWGRVAACLCTGMFLHRKFYLKIGVNNLRIIDNISVFNARWILVRSRRRELFPCNADDM